MGGWGTGSKAPSPELEERSRRSAVILMTPELGRPASNPAPPPPLGKHTESQENDGQTGVAVLRQGSAHKSKPKGAVRQTTVRQGRRAETSPRLRNGGGAGGQERTAVLGATVSVALQARRDAERDNG